MLNLRTHSVYSYKRGILFPNNIAEKAKEMGCNSFCITDYGSLSSFIKAFSIASKLDMKFIPGYECLIKPQEDFDTYNIMEKVNYYKKEMGLKRTTDELKEQYTRELERLNTLSSTAISNHTLIILAKNQKGLKNLFHIYNLEQENPDGIYLNTNDNIVESLDCENCIVISGGNTSELIFYLDLYLKSNELEEKKNEYLNYVEEIIVKFKNKFKDNYYISIEYDEFYKEAFLKLVELAQKHDIKLIAENNVFYNNKEDEADYHMFNNVMNMTDYDDLVYHTNYYMSEDQLKSLMLNIYDKETIEKAFNNIEEIDSKIELIEPPKANQFVSLDDELRKLCEEGWEKLRKGTDREQESLERYNYELEVIKEKNFSQYFINVLNICKLAKSLNILLGPGRGSGCGSEICYLIGITEVDPLEYNLYFERFLNPSRHGFPDIDLDLASVPRTLVDMNASKEEISKLMEENDENEESASRNLLVSELLDKGVFNFTGYINNEVTASTLVLFKNLARYYEIPFQEANKISTDEKYSQKLTEKTYDGWLREACDQFDLEWEDVWEVVDKHMDFCYRLAKIPYNSSVAASGVIMATTDINLSNDNNYFYDALPKHGEAIGFNGKDLESWNYVKYDLLSINTLNQIQSFDGNNFDWNDYYDPKVWDTIQKGDTTFVFQFSSPGMVHILTSVKPKDIQTLAEINALYRPGPLEMGLVEKYIAIKTGNITKETALTEEEEIISKILKQEFGENHTGLLIFQEDVMKVCQVGAGFTLAEADDIRKAMGKKDSSALIPYKDKFINGWRYGGSPEKIWEALEGFAKYAFNKSHAVAYSIIAYKTAEIWTYNPIKFLEFSINFDTKKRQNIAIEKCKELEIGFKYPTIQNMDSKIVEIKNNNLLFGGEASRNFDSYVEFLFSEEILDRERYNLIYKGVCDRLTKDRLALINLIDGIQSKFKKIALFMENEEDEDGNIIRFRSFNQILKSLKDIGAVTHFEKDKNDSNLLNVYIKKSRGNDALVQFHSNESNYCKLNICKYDRKFFGMIRSGIISDQPYINTNGIENLLERTTMVQKSKGADDKAIYYKLKDILNEYMRDNFQNDLQKTYEDVYVIVKETRDYDRSTKLFISFNDKDDILYVSGNNKMRTTARMLDKNSLVKLKLIYSPYIARRNNQFIYDFDIADLEWIRD